MKELVIQNSRKDCPNLPCNLSNYHNPSPASFLKVKCSSDSENASCIHAAIRPYNSYHIKTTYLWSWCDVIHAAPLIVVIGLWLTCTPMRSPISGRIIPWIGERSHVLIGLIQSAAKRFIVSYEYCHLSNTTVALCLWQETFRLYRSTKNKRAMAL